MKKIVYVDGIKIWQGDSLLEGHKIFRAREKTCKKYVELLYEDKEGNLYILVRRNKKQEATPCTLKMF